MTLYLPELLVGKTIISAKINGIVPEEDESFDDKPYLDLEFSDGSSCRIEGCYGGWTGNSIDEYPAFIIIKEFKENKK